MRSRHDAFGNDRERVEQLSAFTRLERVGRAGDVGKHPPARSEDPRAFREPLRKIDVDEDVATPDPIGDSVRDRHRFDSGFDDLDVVPDVCFRHCPPSKLDVARHRIYGDRTQPVFTHETDRVDGVACAHVDDQLTGFRPER